MDTLAGLISLAIVLAIIAVVGHGLWVFAAWIFRSLTGYGEDASQPCPHCGSRYGVRYGRCLNCGQTSQTTTGGGSVREELATTLKQLSRLHDKGAISRQQYDELTAAIRAELASLFAPQQTPAVVQAAPVAPNASEAVLAEVVDAVLVETPANEPAGMSPSRGLAAQGPSHPKPAQGPSHPEPVPVHPLDRPYVPEPPRAPSRPGRAWAEVLQSFMEESNIRWGEILAAVLIVLCSVGLVVSLRNTLKQIPYFPAILFTAFTVAFHGAGLYTLRKWNLQAVSRVILIISLLLVPLTFSGAVVLSGTGEGQRSAADPMFLLVLAAGIGIFAWVCYSASRELVGRAAWPLSIGVLVASVSHVLIHRTPLAGLGIGTLNLIAAMPVGAFLFATLGQLALTRRWRRLSVERVKQILLVLGVAVFALLAPLILLLVKSDPKWLTLARLSPQLSIAAAAILALGLIIHKRTTAKHLAAWQTAGTGVVVFAGALLLMLIMFAWPEPELLLAVGLINGFILAVLGVFAGLPLLYVPAVACAALALTIGVHLAGGHFAIREQLPLKLVQAAMMGRTGVALTVLGAAIAAIGGWLKLRNRRDDALMLLASTGGLAAIAILVALFSGFVSIEAWPQDRDLSAAILLIYSTSLIAAAVFVARDSTLVLPKYSGQLLTGGGSLLLWAALVQALYANATTRGWLESLHALPDRPVLTATLAHGVLTALLALALAGRSVFAGVATFRELLQSRRSQLVVDPLAIGAAISLVVIVPFLCGVLGAQFGTHAVMAIVAALGWAMIAAARRWPGAIAALQAMTALAPALAIIDSWNTRRLETPWYQSHEQWLVQLMALAVGAAVWSAVRRLTSGREVLRDLLGQLRPSVDQVLLGAAAIGLPVVTLWAAVPQVGWELGFHPGDVTVPSLPILSFGWIALAIACAALAVSLWERITLPSLMGLGIATFAAVWLAADQFAPQIAAASAARWAAGIYAIVWGTAYIARDQLRAAAKQLPWLRWQKFNPQAGPWFCAQPLVFGGATILILTIIAVNQNLAGVALRGPEIESIFHSAGPTASYAGPLLALVAVLLGYSLRERQAGFALGGWLVFQLAVNLAFLLHVDAHPATSAIHTIECFQWNSLAAGAFAIVWLGLARWITPLTADEQARELAEWLWRAPVVVAAAAAGAIVVWAGVAIVDQPINPHPNVAVAGSWMSYVAVLLILAAVAWRYFGNWQLTGIADAAAWIAAALVTLVAASLNKLDPGGHWIAYHALELGWLAVGAIACGLVYRQSSRFAPHHLSAAFLAGLVTLLAIRGNFRDWQEPWWSLAMALGACGIMTTLGLARRSQLYAYASTILVGLAMVLYWAAPATWSWHRAIFGAFDRTILAWFECVPLAVMMATGFWLWREIAAQRRLDQSFDIGRYTPRVHALVLIGLVPLYGTFRLLVTMIQDAPQPFDAYDIASLITTLTFGCLLACALWDRRANFTLPLLYLWGAAVWCLAIGLARQWLGLAEERVTALILAAAAHVALTGQIWSYGANLAALGAKLGVSDPVGGLVRTARWLPVVNLLVAAIVCGLDLVLVLNLDDLPLRVAAACGPAIAAWGILCLAQERRREALQLTALLVAGLSAVYLGWAQLEPSQTAALWLDRVFRLLMVLSALTFVYGLALPRFLLTTGSWYAATRKAGYIVGSAALLTFVATLALEVVLFVPGEGAPVKAPQVIAIAVVLVGLIAGLISLAVLPGRDPLVLSDKGRQVYTYAALATTALLFAHLYVCEPQWFDGILKLYWPFIVMGLAFLGVGASELFHRWRVTVLAEPLERTGSLLPLLPVLGMWAADSEVEYSLLLFTVGLLYLALSYARKSWAAMIAAVVAGNGALWSLLSDTEGLRFAQNPQLWLIPPALSALVAAQVNRRRLAPEMLTGIRYAATVVIYVSSTSQLFIDGIESLWPPMVLLALAVAGALLGIALRVRAFLYLGMSFTLLALIGMVAHAARSIDHTGPWWVFGIALGVALLILLGIREKKRDEMHALIGWLKQWEQ